MIFSIQILFSFSFLFFNKYILKIFIVKGCDASVIIASPNGDAEKDAKENLSLPGDGFDTVIKAKEAVEAACPNVVSCADILALATRDVIALVSNIILNI